MAIPSLVVSSDEWYYFRYNYKTHTPLILTGPSTLLESIASDCKSDNSQDVLCARRSVVLPLIKEISAHKARRVGPKGLNPQDITITSITEKSELVELVVYFLAGDGIREKARTELEDVFWLYAHPDILAVQVEGLFENPDSNVNKGLDPSSLQSMSVEKLQTAAVQMGRTHHHFITTFDRFFQPDAVLLEEGTRMK